MASLKMSSPGLEDGLQELEAERQTSKLLQSGVKGSRRERPAYSLGETKSIWGAGIREDFLQEAPLESWGRAVCQASTDHPVQSLITQMNKLSLVIRSTLPCPVVWS